MIDQIGGWTTAGVVQGYGEGYALRELENILVRLNNVNLFQEYIIAVNQKTVSVIPTGINAKKKGAFISFYSH